MRGREGRTTLAEGPSVSSKPAGSLVKIALVLSALTFATQLLRLVVQMIIAKNFGAGLENDAFLAANTLPTYLSNIWLSTVNGVVVPIFIRIVTEDGEEQGFTVLAWVVIVTAVLFASFGAMGTFFAGPLLGVLTPGLVQASMTLAQSMSLSVWLAAILSSGFSVISAASQAQRRYVLTVIGPLLGTGVQIVFLVVGSRLGGMSIAWSYVACTIVQLLTFAAYLRGKFRAFSLKNIPWARLLEVGRLIAPLVVVQIFSRFTPLVERHLASGGSPGSISRLNYAGRIVQIIALLISSGFATIIFTRLSEHAARNDRDELVKELNRGLRLVYTAVIPFVALCIGIANPMVRILFQRGNFQSIDTGLVASYLRLYAIACVGMCIGSVSGKIFYVERRTVLLSVMSIIEMIAFMGYSFLLRNRLGIGGIAVAYSIFFNFSVLWHLMYAVHIYGWKVLKGTVSCLIKSSVAGVSALVFSYLVGRLQMQWLLAGALGGVGGAIVYLAVLWVLRSAELNELFGSRRRIVLPAGQGTQK
jgi:putative peptidoglycan lipid II flippase